MRRIVLLASVALLVAATAAQAGPIGLGVGAFGGLSWPILQDDVSNGSVFGVRVPVKALSMLTFEGYYMKSSLGDAEEEIGGVSYTREGFDHTGIGVNAVFGSGGLGGHGLELRVGLWNQGGGQALGSDSRRAEHDRDRRHVPEVRERDSRSHLQSHALTEAR
jgi:hypothetical protein